MQLYSSLVNNNPGYLYVQLLKYGNSGKERKNGMQLWNLKSTRSKCKKGIIHIAGILANMVLLF